MPGVSETSAVNEPFRAGTRRPRTRTVELAGVTLPATDAVASVTRAPSEGDSTLRRTEPVLGSGEWPQPARAEASPVTLTANAARSYALVPGVPGSLGGATAWIVGILVVFIPLCVWRYRRMS